MPKPSRSVVDLSHFVFQSHKIGRLQTHSVIPIVAGDSFELDYESVYRLIPLQRNLLVDAKVDLFAFYIPHRHVYGELWNDFIKDGHDETVTFPTSTVKKAFYLGASSIGSTLTNTAPLWRTKGYDMIWNRYFKHPSDSDSDFEPTKGKTDQNEFGRLCCYEKAIWNTGMTLNHTLKSNNTTAQVHSSRIDIRDLNIVSNLYNHAVKLDWFNKRYTDILKGTWGSGVNIDADERPLLIMRSSKFLSGYDVDGTGSTNLGVYSGKSVGKMSLRFPRRHFPEHGSLWIMSLIRFPVVHAAEQHYLDKIPNPTYMQLACDSDLLSHQKPHEHFVKDFFDTESNSSLGMQPYGQWYRYHPHVVHNKLRDYGHYPILEVIPDTGVLKSHYHKPREFDTSFKGPQNIGHCISQGHLSIKAFRYIPTSASSLFVR